MFKYSTSGFATQAPMPKENKEKKEEGNFDRRFLTVKKPSIDLPKVEVSVLFLPNVKKQGDIPEHVALSVENYVDASITPSGERYSAINRKFHFNDRDPLVEHNDKLYAEWKKTKEVGTTLDKERLKFYNYARGQQRYITNVLVLEDTLNPANVGKVLLYKMPKTVYNKLEEMVHGNEHDESVSRLLKKKGQPIYDLNNLKPFVITAVQGVGKDGKSMPDYINSGFCTEPLQYTEQEYIAVLEQTFDVSEFGSNIVDKSSYEMDKARFDKVFCLGQYSHANIDTVPNLNNRPAPVRSVHDAPQSTQAPYASFVPQATQKAPVVDNGFEDVPPFDKPYVSTPVPTTPTSTVSKQPDYSMFMGTIGN
jgi:hypothetical protein